MAIAPIDYGAVISSLADGEEVLAFLLERLPPLWVESYLDMTSRLTDICQFQAGSFSYIFDDYATLGAKWLVAPDVSQEGRLVAVFGKSDPQPRKRDDYRLKGWAGRTERDFGKEWDKGHYMAHSLGGAVDGIEANVFVQRRDLNRGWSRAGRRFRSMEDYCHRNAGTFCFSRPIYEDGMARPTVVEFGVLKPHMTLWVECFNNRQESGIRAARNS